MQSPGRADRIFLRLGANGALGADGLQRIFYVPTRSEVPPLDAPLNARDWKAVSFIRSTKAILLRCIQEKGVELTHTARLELERLHLPSTSGRLLDAPLTRSCTRLWTKPSRKPPHET